MTTIAKTKSAVADVIITTNNRRIQLKSIKNSKNNAISFGNPEKVIALFFLFLYNIKRFITHPIGFIRCAPCKNFSSAAA